MKLPIGKLDPRLLSEKVFKYLGYCRNEVILGPMIGGDAAVLRIGDQTLVFKSDPIVGASRNIGRLAVNIVSNDVACLGAETVAISLVLLMPEEATEDDVEKIMKDAHKEALKHKIAIVGGHSEVAAGLRRRPPLVIASALGIPVNDNIVLPCNIKPGDKIIMTKTVAIEGTAIIASEFQEKLKKIFSMEFVERAKQFIEKISVIKEALILAKNNLTHGMHDPTDGGLLEGLYELSEASGKGFIVWEEKIPIAHETMELSKYFGIDPLKLISSGVLLAAVPVEKVDIAIKKLQEEGISSAVIGEIIDDQETKLIIRKSGKKEYIKEPVLDELWKLFKP